MISVSDTKMGEYAMVAKLTICIYRTLNCPESKTAVKLYGVVYKYKCYYYLLNY